MVHEVLQHLDPRPGQVFVDLTVGAGGHASHVLTRMGTEGRVIGVDRDAAVLEFARRSLEAHGERAVLVRGTFGDLRAILEDSGIGEVDGVLLDLGVSSLQLDEPERGFSFREAGPLDMRMSAGKGRTAFEIVRDSSPEELERIFREFGEEPFARRIATRLCDLRRRRPPRTTQELASFVASIVPQRLRGRRAVHPATRVFQALRIAVNDELGQLDRVLEHAPDCLAPGGRIVILAYHSLEDRRVKVAFRDAERRGALERLTKKPVKPSPEEIARNPRARSALLRAARRPAESPAS